MNSNNNNNNNNNNDKDENDIQPKFAMDISLYRFAKQLRLLGCDVLCDDVHRQHSLIDAAEREGRIVVTSVGKSIPLLHKFALIGDLTFGKAFENLKIVVVRNKTRSGDVFTNKQIQVVKKNALKKKLMNNEDDDDDDEDSDEDGDDERGSDDDDGKDKEEGNGGAVVSGYAAFLEDNTATTATDPRKFHWVNEEDPSTKKMRKRRRRLVGYNSDGESDYEYEDDKKSEAKLKQEQQEEAQQQQQQQAETKSKSTSHNNVQKGNNNNKEDEKKQFASSKAANNQIQDDAMQPITDEILRKLTVLVKSATPGSVAAIAANACNSALRHAQKFPHHQNPAVRYIVVDIHATFKQMLSAIILISGVSWQPSVLFTRCVKDNEKITDVKREDVKDCVSPPIYRLYQNFYQCPQCKNVFWGVDNGLVVNFKSARTTEYLRTLFEDGAEANPLDEERKNGNDDDDDDHNETSSPSSSFENNNNNNNQVVVVDSSNKVYTKMRGAFLPTKSSRLATKWGFMQRHIFSFPRKVKIVIFDFMTNDDLDNLVLACPMFAELVDKKKNGMDMKFVREDRLKGSVKSKQPEQQ